jgi:YkoY family integral membrane protein
MVTQTFQPSDFGVIGFLVVLEALLSADNALVLAMMVRHLKPEYQRRALLYGLGGAFVFRFLAILIAATLINLWWLQAIGAIYLLFLTVNHFRSEGGKQKDTAEYGFWRTVVAVEITDIAFAVDSVLAAVSAVGDDNSKLWVIYTGAVIGVVLLRLAAGALTRLISTYPKLESVAYAIVGWAGVKLAFLAAHHATLSSKGKEGAFPHLPNGVFWVGTLAILAVGSIVSFRKDSQIESDTENDSA